MPYSLIDGAGWLNLTNGVLGIAVVACVVLIAGSLVHDLIVRARQPRRRRD